MKKTFPEFLATPIKNNPDAKKIFPVIGLKDKSVKLKVNKALLDVNFRRELVHYLTAFINKDRYYDILTDNDRAFLQSAKQINSKLQDNLVISKDLKKKLSDLRKLNKYFISEKRIWWLEETFKTYYNLSKSNLKICFSTKQWDLATISMRGVKSCQSWDNQCHRKYLQGTVLDPFVGVVYITDNKKTQYGNKMLFRSLVRYTWDTQGKQQQLFMEPIYHNSKYSANRPIYNCLGYYSSYFHRVNKEHNFMLKDVFVNFFNKHAKKVKTTIGYVAGDGNNYVVPRSIYENHMVSLSLSDTGICKHVWLKNNIQNLVSIAPEVNSFLCEVLPN